VKKNVSCVDVKIINYLVAIDIWQRIAVASKITNFKNYFRFGPDLS